MFNLKLRRQCLAEMDFDGASDDDMIDVRLCRREDREARQSGWITDNDFWTPERVAKLNAKAQAA